MKPIKIQVSVTEALALNCHKDVFFKNGFKFTQVEGENTGFNLTSLPISKSITFTIDDFYELLGLVMEHLDLDHNNIRNSESVTG